MPFKVTGMTATGEIQIECNKASEALAQLDKMRSSGKTINCAVKDPSGQPIRDVQLIILARKEERGDA